MKAVFLDRATFNIDTPAPQALGEFVCYDGTPQDDQTIIERCLDADIIITNKVQIHRTIIQQLPKLKLVQVAATGVNNVDQAALDDHDIVLQNVADYSYVSVPEHTLGLILNAMRATNYYHRCATDGTWQASGQFCLNDVPILDLYDKTLGIIGAGTIGKKVAKIAQAFGLKVLFAERQGRPPRDDRYSVFDEVLANSDIISLHTPLTCDTYHLINDDTIAKMHKRPLIVNVARGDVVDSHAIVKALNNDKILGYASDVFAHEPPKDDPLFDLIDHPRVIFTPHNAWSSDHAQRTLWQILCQRIDDFVLNNQ